MKRSDLPLSGVHINLRSHGFEHPESSDVGSVNWVGEGLPPVIGRSRPRRRLRRLALIVLPPRNHAGGG